MTEPFFIFMLGVLDSQVPALPTSVGSVGRQALGGITTVFAAGFAVLGLVLVWAVFIRKSDARRQRGTLSQTPAESIKSKHSRRRRSKETRRNVTLAEAGGLPPRGSGEITPPKS